MPTLKKRSGKTTITLYAQEVRQIQGAIETFKFVETNDRSQVGRDAGIAAQKMAEALRGLKPAETQGELIPDDKKGAAK